MEPNKNEKMEEHNTSEECEREGRSRSYARPQNAVYSTNEDMNTLYFTEWSDDDPEEIPDKELVEGVLKVALRMPNIPYLKKFKNRQTNRKLVVCTPNLNDDVALSQFESQVMKTNDSDDDNGGPIVVKPTSNKNITFLGSREGAKVFRCVQGRLTYVFLYLRTPGAISAANALKLCEHLKKVEMTITENSGFAGCSTTKAECADGTNNLEPHFRVDVEGPLSQPNVRAGVLLTTQTNVRVGKLPTTQPYVRPFVDPTTQPNVRAGVLPTTEPNVRAGVLPTTQTNVRAGVLPTTQVNIHSGLVPADHSLGNRHACAVICPPDTPTLLPPRVDDTPIPLRYRPTGLDPRFLQPLAVDRFPRFAGMMSPNVTGILPMIATEGDMMYNILRAYYGAGLQPNFIPAIPVHQQPTPGFINLAHPGRRGRARYRPRRRVVPLYSPYDHAHQNITSMSHVYDPRVFGFQPPMHMTRNVYNPTTLPAPAQPHTIPGYPSTMARAPPTMNVEVDPSYDDTVTIEEDDE